MNETMIADGTVAAKAFLRVEHGLEDAVIGDAVAAAIGLFEGFSGVIAGEWDALPETARQGIVRLAAHLVTHRDRAEDALPASVAALWRPLRQVRL